MGFWSSISSAVSSIASTILLDYRKYGSIYRSLEIESTSPDMNLGVGDALKKELNDLPDTNSDYLLQFLSKPLEDAFDYFETSKILKSQRETLSELRKVKEETKSEHLEKTLTDLSENIEILTNRLDRNSFRHHLK